jgi:hypothetical protein
MPYTEITLKSCEGLRFSLPSVATGVGAKELLPDESGNAHGKGTFEIKG